ncbi:transcription termination factor Rho [Slackia piriformis]|uniref:transcription termination factor Rho n=1 Tax=Slackia piriformis TaxID=626934 RepID=UPI0026DBEC91|nr:transcription termination factor Rho [Slackia piriformis]MDO5023644.1 transcription termination factor Rho [Slackia piriformis]
MISDEMTKAEAAEAPASASIAPADAGKAAEAQQTEAPKKRVGRPRKKTEADEKPASEEGQKEAPASSRRASASSRVSAKEAIAPMGEMSGSADESAAPKHATRTTRKKAASDEETENAAPRKRTRRAAGDSAEVSSSDRASEKPRQEMIQFESDASSAKSDESSSRAENAAATDQEASSKPATRKRPGRSTKLRMAIEAAESADEKAGKASEDADALQESSDEEKPARRRSARSRKAKTAFEQHEQGAEESASRDDAGSVEERQKDGGSEHRGDVEKSGSELSEDAKNHEKQDRRERDYRSQRNQQRQNQRERRQNKQNGKQDGQQNRDRGNDRRDRDRDRGNEQHRRQRRTHSQNREPIAPKTNMEELAKLKVAELREKAAELGLDATGLKKAELVEKVYEAAVRAEGFIEVEGILDVLQDGYGFLRTKGYLPSENDVYVGLATIRRNGLRKGDLVKGQTRPARENEKYAALQQVLAVNGIPVDEQGERVRFGDLTPVFPDECLIMEHGKSTITARVIDLVSPIGKGQRGLIVSPPKAGKTTVLKDIAAAITANNPEVHLMCLLVDERPEEVTDMQRSIKGEVIASTFDMPTENHIAVSELVIERAKRLVERGEDVVVLLDSLTRLARAYNLAQPASGRILSGGVDSTALYPPKRFLGAARNIEGGGSLTILASALIETGSKMDEVIFEEFKGTGNMELKLDRSLADRRVFPAIDPVASGTRREDLLLNPQEAPLIWAVRRILSNMNSTERAMDMLIKSLKQTDNNQEFLLRTAKKAQGNRDAENIEF